MLEAVPIPYDALVFDGAAAARLDGPAPAEPEVVAALLSRVIRQAAEADAGAPVRPVSVSVDVAGAAGPEAALSFAAVIDRRTRTLVFAHGNALAGGETVLTATAVYRVG